MTSDGPFAIEVTKLSKIYRLYGSPRDRVLELLDPRRRPRHRPFAALDSVSFTIGKGESVAFIGKNGAGKSTLLKAITGIITPTSGEVRVHGVISALLELGTGFNPELSGRKNVYFTGAIMGVSRAEMDRRIDAILAFADIGSYIDQPVKRYSSGMFVRLAFAVAVHVDPDILIVDEALSVGDMRFQQKCYRRIREFKEAGVTVLFVSHDMGSVLSFCDRCLWLKDGKVEIDGPPAEVSRAYSAYMNYDAALTAAGSPRKAAAPPASTEALWQDVDAFASFGDRGAVVTRVAFTAADGLGRLEMVRGDEHVVCAVEVLFHQDMPDPLYGILLKDAHGNQVLSINSYVYEHTPLPRRAGDRVVFKFAFRFPMLRNGEYALSIAIAQGTLDVHVQHHWVHDVLVVKVANHDLPHRLNCVIVPHDVALSESP